MALVAGAIKDGPKRKGIVLDPFDVQYHHHRAEKTGHRARAMELDPKYVDVAVRRALHRQVRGARRTVRPLTMLRPRAWPRTTASWQERRWLLCPSGPSGHRRSVMSSEPRAAARRALRS